MKINKIRIKNLCGISTERQYDLSPKVVGLFGKNGAGKSSAINAIRFAIGGEKNTELLHIGATNGAVRIETDKAIIDRALKKTSTNNAMTCWINGEKKPANKVQDELAQVLNTSKENLKILSSRDLEQSLASDAGKILLSYANGTLSTSDVKDLLKQAAIENKEISNDQIDNIKFPDQISWTLAKDISSAYIEQRRKLRADINAMKTLYQTLHVTDLGDAAIPELDTAKTELEEITKQEVLKKNYDKLLKEYETANNKRNKLIQEINEKEKQLNSLEKTVTVDLETLEKQKDSIIEKANAEKEKVAKASGTIEALSPLLDKMGTGMCPLSSEKMKITCKTDMTDTKNEIANQINEAKKIIEVSHEKKAILTDEYRKITEMIVKAKQYDTLKINIETMKKTLPEEIKKPEIETISVDENRKRVLQTVIKNYEIESQKKELERKRDTMVKSFYLADFIAKEFAEKGCITKALLNEYLGTLSAAAQKAEKETGIMVYFENDNGIKISYSIGDDTRRPYETLSTGEKMLAFLTVSDLLHRIASIPVLVLDDLDKLDLDNLEGLLSLIDRVKDSYENIILAGVNHLGVDEVLRKHNIPNLLSTDQG